MLDNRDVTLGLGIITTRARSAAKALSMVTQELIRSRVPGEDPRVFSLRLDEDQLQAFQYLVESVLDLTRETTEIVDAMAKASKDNDDMPSAGNAKTTRKGSSEDYMPKMK
jgi:hypothetical protein